MDWEILLTIPNEVKRLKIADIPAGVSSLTDLYDCKLSMFLCPLIAGPQRSLVYWH